MQVYVIVLCYQKLKRRVVDAGWEEPCKIHNSEKGTANVQIFAARSLREPFQAIQDRLWRPANLHVGLEFGPAAVLREKVEAGAPADIMAVPGISHQRKLYKAGRAEEPIRFASNEMVLLVAPERLGGTMDPFDALLNPMLHIGMATPGIDPSGDYAEAILKKLENMLPKEGPGVRERVQFLMGGREPPIAPQGRNIFAWLIETGRADVFLTYRSNAMAAKRDRPKLAYIPLPRELAQPTACHLCLLSGAKADAPKIARTITSEPAQAIFEEFGFDAWGPQD